MVAFPDGRLLISTNVGFMVMDPGTGDVIEHYKLDGMGWAALAPSVDGEHVIIGNFFSGDVIKYRLADGATVATNNLGQKFSLSGVAQYPGS